MTSYTISKNEKFNSFEYSFTGKPCAAIRDALKSAGFRWHAARGLWYGYRAVDLAPFGAVCTNSDGGSTAGKPAKAGSKAAKRATLWQRTRTDELPAYGSDNPLKEAAKAAKEPDGRRMSYEKAAAAAIRKHLRTRFPECKFSVTSGGAGWLDCVKIRLEASPYARQLIKADPSDPWSRDRWTNSAELSDVLDYARALFDAYDADDGDHYADYGARHDLYGGAELAYNYTQSEPTAEILADCADFEAQAAAAAEAEKRAAEERARIDAEERARAAAKEEAERQRLAALLAANPVEVVEIPEPERVAFLGLVEARKPATLEEAQKYTADADPLTVDAIAAHRVDFKNAELFGAFCGRLLADWPFLAGKFGGHAYTTAPEIFNKMNDEQRGAVKVYTVDAVAVYFGGVLQFLIDPEGYSYARYILLPAAGDFSTVETMPAADYVKQEEARTARAVASMRFPAAITEQAAAAKLQAGEPVTVVYVDSMLIGGDLRGVVFSVETVGARVALKILAGRKLYTIEGKDGRDLLLYRGNLPPIPEELKRQKVSEYTFRILDAGAGVAEYMRNVEQWAAGKGFEAIINTLQY